MADYITNGTYVGIYSDTASTRRSQVYQVTHKGEDYLPFMNRSFISFSFGGKNIEDFNLVATISGDRMSRNGYADFEDITSDLQVLDGRFYWGTHYKNNLLQFTLSTDGMSQMDLDNFLQWFSPGKNRELILAEHPNRAIIARVSEPPLISMLPFESTIIKKLGGQNYTTSTTLYKGDINLELTMDEPNWYSKINIFGQPDAYGVYHDTWIDANGKSVNVSTSPDVLKIVLEDGIPISSMLSDSMLLGDSTYANLDNDIGAMTAADENDTDPRCLIATVTVEGIYVQGARISGPAIDAITGIPDLLPGVEKYFYYCGTAPSKPVLTFSLTPKVSGGYIIVPYNKYSNESASTENTISIESIHKKDFKFGLPSVYAAFNQAIHIFDNMTIGESWTDVSLRLRDEVKHAYARQWASKVGSYLSYNSATVSNGDSTKAKIYMSYFLRKKDTNNTYFSSSFKFDSTTGDAVGNINIRLITNASFTSLNISDGENFWKTYGSPATIEENVGDMVRSDYLIIEDRNYPDSNGSIVKWNGTNDTTRSYSHKISHNIRDGLDSIFIEYKNMYL